MLVLASASRARRNLLNNAEIPHRVIVSDINENDFDQKDVISLVDLLAFSKSSSVASKILVQELEDYSESKISAVIGCDSLFEFEGEFFGKPKNIKEAIQRWQGFSSGSGFLHTGHCLLFRQKDFNRNIDLKFNGVLKKVITTKIKFTEISYEEILEYVKTGEPMQCAGGFALDGIGGKFISEINGCYSNVIGLSLPWLWNALKKFQLLD